MSTNKLTLSIDAETVKKAKRYAAAYGTSLSRLLTQYLAKLPDDDQLPLTPKVKRISGVLSPQTDIDEYRFHLHGQFGL